MKVLTAGPVTQTAAVFHIFLNHNQKKKNSRLLQNNVLLGFMNKKD